MPIGGNMANHIIQHYKLLTSLQRTLTRMAPHNPQAISKNLYPT